jgi:hypothetical protein
MGFLWQRVIVSTHPMTSEPAHPHTPHEYGVPQHRDVPHGGFLHRGDGVGHHGQTQGVGSHEHSGHAPGSGYTPSSGRAPSGGHAPSSGHTPGSAHTPVSAHHSDAAWNGPYSPSPDTGAEAGGPSHLAASQHDVVAVSDPVSYLPGDFASHLPAPEARTGAGGGFHDFASQPVEPPAETHWSSSSGFDALDHFA